MEYVYTALLLHSAKKEVSEESVSKVLHAAGIEADHLKAKALVASLKEVNIDDAIAKAAVVAAPAAASGGAEVKHDEKKAVEEEKKSEEEAAAGLAGLFG
ncbi:MAG: 50S ribosomal protein P1 [Candidatus Diapherotrites archaeon]|nr:50S ribosomal protein P1 [Candidatus Diapherotrites archaeon]